MEDTFLGKIILASLVVEAIPSRLPLHIAICSFHCYSLMKLEIEYATQMVNAKFHSHLKVIHLLQLDNQIITILFHS